MAESLPIVQESTQVNDQVKVFAQKAWRKGTVRWIGTLADGLKWAGIELEGPYGHSDGTAPRPSAPLETSDKKSKPEQHFETATNCAIYVLCKNTSREEIAAAAADIKAENRKHWITNDRSCFRHPYARIFTSLFIILCDFFIYAEDPLPDSEVICNIPVAGNVITMVGSKYPESDTTLTALKAIMVVVFSIIGMVIGKFLLHNKLLRDCCKLNMFEEDKGTWLCMGVMWTFSIYVAATMYNLANPPNELVITAGMGFSTRYFSKFAQSCTWLGDLITVCMVWDTLWQDYSVFPNWCLCWKNIWNNACNKSFRVVAVWFFAIVSTSTIFYGIWTAGNENGISWNYATFATDELTRIIIVCCITVVDCCIVMQDWEYPTFDDSLQTNMMVSGTFSKEIKCNCLQKCLDKCLQFKCIQWLSKSKMFEINISGKWLNYGPLLVILCFDMNLMKNQIVYEPHLYGQYVDPDSRNIYTIHNATLLNMAYTADGELIEDNKHLISWETRQGKYDDTKGSNKWSGYSMAVKAACAAPGFIAIIVMIITTVKGNTKTADREKRKTAEKNVQDLKRKGMLATPQGNQVAPVDEVKVFTE